MRTCTRCQLERALSFFSPYGYVCRLCKMEALTRRDNRKRRGGKVGRPRLYNTDAERRARAAEQVRSYRAKVREKARREGSKCKHTLLTKSWGA